MKKLCALLMVVAAGAGPNVVSAERHSGPAAPVAVKLACSGPVVWKAALANAQKSAVYALLQRKVGEPVSCAIANGTLTVKFAQGASLVVATDSKIEYVSQEAVFPASGATVSRDEAVECLKKMVAGDSASAVDWTQFEGPIPSGSVDKEVDGNGCNLKLHIHLEKGVVVGLGRSMAC